MAVHQEQCREGTLGLQRKRRLLLAYSKPPPFNILQRKSEFHGEGLFEHPTTFYKLPRSKVHKSYSASPVQEEGQLFRMNVDSK